ncbi:MAG: caspase family protein, partial [Saprospiraceae bacterium]|nr:caspase family protein [Saprospiraceae bacterium]
MSTTPKSNFYALFVGVNQYAASKVSNLSGCVNDMRKMHNYLLRRTDLKQKYNYHFKALTDDQATRQNILNTFRSHLGQAKKGDIVLFFFAGHGSTEKAHPYWETDQLETLVCHDSRTRVNGKTVRDIMDKEIRFLINEVWQKSGEGAEIILIQDSCHSGGASRFAPPIEDNHTKAKPIENAPLEVPRRRFVRQSAIGNAYTEPEESFGFAQAQETAARQSSSDTGTRNTQTRKPFKEAYPEGRHIHLGACSPLEYAYEVNGGGVFTDNLIRLLDQSKGKISYESLEYRARMAILSGFKQQPNFSFVKTPDGKKYHQFLGSEVIQTAPPAKTYTVSPTARGENSPWYLNAGGVHGLRFVKSTAYLLEERKAISIEVIDV